MVTTTEDIERMFKDEIRDKKRTGIGIFSRTGTRGYVGKMRTPFDIMSKKDKAKFKRSKVLKYNMYDKILPFNEFKQLPTDKKKELLTKWRSEISSEDIKKAWNMNTTNYYKIIKELGITVDRSTRVKGNSLNKDVKQKQNKGEVSVITLQQQQHTTSDFRNLPVFSAPPDGIMFSLEGSYLSEEILKKLMKVAALLEGETNNFKISLNIQEVIPPGQPVTITND